MSELRSLTFGGSNFIDMEDVDFTAMPELTEIVCGEGCFHSGLTLICRRRSNSLICSFARVVAYSTLAPCRTVTFSPAGSATSTPLSCAPVTMTRSCGIAAVSSSTLTVAPSAKR